MLKFCSSHCLELVEFVIPGDKCKVFVGNPPTESSQELAVLFGKYGLVYEAFLKLPDVEEDKEETEANATQTASHGATQNGISKPHRTYGFVTFYTQSAAQLAYKSNHPKPGDSRASYGSNSNRMIVQLAHSKVPRVQKIALPLPSSIQLINYFLGFGQWQSSLSTGISKISPDECSEEARNLSEKSFQENGGTSAVRKGQAIFEKAFSATVKLTFPDGRTVSAEGHGMAKGTDLGRVLSISKKIAVTHARKNAFRCLVIVLINGKVGLKIYPAPLDHAFVATPQDLDDLKPDAPINSDVQDSSSAFPSEQASSSM